MRAFVREAFSVVLAVLAIAVVASIAEFLSRPDVKGQGIKSLTYSKGSVVGTRADTDVALAAERKAADDEITMLKARIAELESETPPVDPPPVDPPPVENPDELPVLGFSLNGEALAGPISSAHLRNLRALSPGDVWARVGFSSDGDWRANVNKWTSAIRAADMKVLLRASFPGNQWNGQVPLNTTAYGQFVGEMAQYAKSLGLGPDVLVFEYPNEINSTKITGTQYAEAAKAAYPRLKFIDPNYKIIGASEHVYLGNWKPWLAECFNAGFFNASDGVSFHNYDVANDHQRYTYLRQLMVQHNATSKMVWVSEFGVPTPPSPSGKPLGGQTPENQAKLLVANLQDMGADLPWIDVAMVYADLDIPSRPNTNEGWFGIYTNTSSWEKKAKLAVEAIRSLYHS